jgi:peptide/nickel transport system permease protein
MATTTTTMQPEAPVEVKTSASRNSAVQLLRYTGIRLVALFFTVLVGVYLTILIANMGGYVDNIRRGQIREGVSIAVSMDPEIRQLPQAERAALIEGLIAVEEERLGLNQPFVIRSFRFLVNAMTLNLGRAEQLTSDSGSKEVRRIILERLPHTLVLFATANIVLFFTALFVGLVLSRQYGSLLDKMVISLAPSSAVPGWFYGIFLILIFAALLGWLPFGGAVKAPPPESSFEYALSLLRHMILPASAVIISAVFILIYDWRTFFLIFSSEDYVEMAKAKGLSSRQIERRYILRPTLPNIITRFLLLVIGLWTGAIILETVFNWPGLGRLLYRAIGLFDTPVIVGSAVIYAYLLAITVFLLDIIYAFVDPRVKVGAGGQKS